MSDTNITTTQPDAPEGYMLNALGHLVPCEQVREHDLLRDETVRALAEKALAINKALTEFKAAALTDIADLITGRDIPTDPYTGHQADHHTDTEDLPHE